MNTTAEFYNSELLGIEATDTEVTLQLMLCLHQNDGRPGIDSGRSWRQRAKLQIEDGIVSERPRQDAFRITDGTLEVGPVSCENLVPLPLDALGETELAFEGKQGRLVVTGARARLLLLDEQGAKPAIASTPLRSRPRTP